MLPWVAEFSVVPEKRAMPAEGRENAEQVVRRGNHGCTRGRSTRVPETRRASVLSRKILLTWSRASREGWSGSEGSARSVGRGAADSRRPGDFGALDHASQDGPRTGDARGDRLAV